MDSEMAERLTIHWVEVPSSDGGRRLEMRWATTAVAAASHAA